MSDEIVKIHRITEKDNVKITNVEDGQLRFDHDALHDIFMRPEMQDKPFAIISIAGISRSGKSFLMNFLLRYLRNNGWTNQNWMGDDDCTIGSDGIIFKAGLERCTTGIRIFREIFELSVEKQKVMVMIMDSQGLFDQHTTKLVNTLLLTLTTLMSSVQIFNCMRQIDMQQLEYLKACVDFAKETGQKSESTEDCKTYMKLQNLVFLVRDSLKTKENMQDNYGLRRGNEYLDQILQCTDGGDELIQIRTGIKTSFEKVDCFMMPKPGSGVERESFAGRNGDIKKVFRQYVREFVEHIGSPKNLKPKQTGSRIITPREMLNMIGSCDVAFSQNAINAATMLQMNEKSYYSSLYEEAIAEYDDIMKRRGENVESIYQLQNTHDQTKQEVAEKFKRRPEFAGAEAYKEQYKQHLDDTCNKHFENTTSIFLLRIRERKLTKEREATKAFSEYKEKFEEEKFAQPNDVPWTENKIQSVHTKHYERIRSKYAETVDEDVLKTKVEHFLQLFKRGNDWHRKYCEEKDTNERKRKLEKIVETLETKVIAKWTKFLSTYRDKKAMEKKEEQISLKCSGLFWQKAPLSEQENSDIKRELAERNEQASEEELHANTWIQNCLLVPVAARVATAVHLPGAFNEKIIEFLERHAPEAGRKHRELVLIMKSRYEKAQKENEEKWNNLDESIKIEVDCLILQVKVFFSQCMRDCVYREVELKTLLNEIKLKYGNKLFQSDDARMKQAFKEYFDDEFQKAYDGILRENKENETYRNIHRKSIPKWKTILCAVRDFAQHIGPVLIGIAQIIVTLVK